MVSQIFPHISPQNNTSSTRLVYTILIADYMMCMSCTCSCCSWNVSYRRCILCSHCAGRSWRTGRETPYRRNPSGSFSWCCRSHITWTPDRSVCPHLSCVSQFGLPRCSTVEHISAPFYHLYSKYTTLCNK